MAAAARIGITGATGGIGRRVVARLAARDVPVRLIVRDPARLAPSTVGDPARAEIAVAGYDDLDACRRAFEGLGTLLLVSGSESADRLEQHRTAVRAAADAGVGRVVYTSFLGAAPDAVFTLARDHAHTERALAEAGLAWAALRDSLYADVLPHFAVDGVIAGPAGDGRFAPVARDDVADVAVAALLDPTVAGPLDVTGPDLLTMAEVAEVIARATGRPIRYIAETPEEARSSRQHPDVPDWQVDAWVSTYTAIAAGEMAVVAGTVERLAGHPPMPLEQALAGRAG